MNEEKHNNIEQAKILLNILVRFDDTILLAHSSPNNDEACNPRLLGKDGG